ncbi:hypothetical protein BJ741DRAFT_598478 [Chytriomyces cf. hyalinus JEL632]|nr:hypothetical protein BJ741DRAFT_598478 [Chytriomyces cf. hyalinus JEL632]
MREFLTPSLHELQDLSAYLVSNDGEGGHGKRVSGSASNCSGDSDTDQPKKKLGRKPANTEPANKRIAQNRQAQRLYRERKEQHVKDLERQVEELKAASTGNAGASVLGLEMENGALKAQNAALLKQVADLQTENAMLRQMTFSYDFGSGVGVGSAQAGSSPSSLVSQTNSAFLQNVSPYSSPSFGLGFSNLAAVSPNSLMKSPASVSVPSPASTDLVSLLGSHVSQKAYSGALDFSSMFPPINGAPDFGKVPIDVRLDSFMFDDQDWLTMSGLASSASVNKLTTAPAVLNATATSSGIKALSENGKEDVLSQLADVSGLVSALKSVPSLKDKAHLVDDVCFVFQVSETVFFRFLGTCGSNFFVLFACQEFISKATKAIMEGRTAPDCPLEMYKKKLAIIESCQGDAVDSQRVLDIFAVTKEKFCGFLDKAACAGTSCS